MAKDRIVIRMIFSGALIIFGILHLIYTIFSRFVKQSRFRKDLNHIKDNNIDDIVQESLQQSDISTNEASKKEIDTLLKDIYFNLYHKSKNNEEIEEGYSEIEYSIDNVLDNNILHLIEEKDKLLQEKDRIIVMLEEKNEKFINETISKIDYIVKEKDSLLEDKDSLIMEKEKEIQTLHNKINKFAKGGGKKLGLFMREKDKLIIEKDKIIMSLYNKLQQEEILQIPKPPQIDKKEPENTGPKYHHSENFLNVNH